MQTVQAHSLRRGQTIVHRSTGLRQRILRVGNANDGAVIVFTPTSEIRMNACHIVSVEV